MLSEHHHRSATFDSLKILELTDQSLIHKTKSQHLQLWAIVKSHTSQLPKKNLYISIASRNENNAVGGG